MSLDDHTPSFTLFCEEEEEGEEEEEREEQPFPFSRSRTTNTVFDTINESLLCGYEEEGEEEEERGGCSLLPKLKSVYVHFIDLPSIEHEPVPLFADPTTKSRYVHVFVI